MGIGKRIEAAMLAARNRPPPTPMPGC